MSYVPCKVFVVRRTYAYPLLAKQLAFPWLESTLAQCRHLYNGGLEQRITWWKQGHKHCSYTTQTAQLTELRLSDPAWDALSVEIERSALRRLDHAFKAFFDRVKRGETPGFPRFKSRDRYDSFSFPKPIIDHDRVKIPNFGWIKFHKYRQIPAGAKVCDAKIKRCKTGQWVVCFSVELPSPVSKPLAKVQSPIGIDVGLTTYATLSNGDEIPNPRHYRAAEEQLARAQQNLARKSRGSHNRLRAKQSLARASQHVTNQRLDFSRKQAKELVAKHDLILFEALKISNMIKNRSLSKSISDAGWRQFMQCVENKAEEAGSHVHYTKSHGTTIDCCRCGEAVKKTLSERVHQCPRCELVIGRDLNAAINILSRGLRDLELDLIGPTLKEKPYV